METKRPRMAIEDRAKQFAPFAALTGFEEAIARRDRIALNHSDYEFSDDYDDLMYQAMTAEDIEASEN